MKYMNGNGNRFDMWNIKFYDKAVKVRTVGEKGEKVAEAEEERY